MCDRLLRVLSLSTIALAVACSFCRAGGQNGLKDVACSADKEAFPRAVIKEVRVDSRPVEFASTSKLAPGRGELNFVFTALSSPSPEKVSFRYLLQGFDENFRYQQGTRGEEHYTNIAPGRYSFRVWSGNGHGLWMEPPAVYSFYLQPHFYQTWWFYALCALLLVILCAALYQVSVRVRERNLLDLVQERTQQLADANALLRRLSNLDGLTGIANRRHFEESMNHEWARARRTDAAIAVVMIDIDCFKDFNDGYGHQRGDDCLKQVASVLQASLLRAGDLVARYGGDEFIAVLANTGAEAAFKIAEMLRARIYGLKITHEKSPARCVTISLGVASCVPSEDQTPMDLIALSDRALYRAKRRGRNRTVQADALPLAVDSLELVHTTH